MLQKVYENYFLVNYLLNALAVAFTYIDNLLTAISDVLLITNDSEQIVMVNQSALQILEYGKEDLILKPISIILKEINFLYQNCKINSDLPLKSFKDCEVICYSKTGKELIISFSKISTKIEGLEHFLYIGRDMTERKRLEKALYEEKELAQVTLQSIGDAVINTDINGKINYMNPVAEQMTRWSLADAQGKALTEILKIINETTRETVENPVEKALSSGSIVNLTRRDTILIARDGSEVPIDDSAAPIRDRDGQIIGAVMVFQDVSQKRSMAHQLSWQATHDPLTGLFNRREFERRLELALTIGKTQNQQHAVCYLDLDRFKIVNDTCGHLAGDELLRQVTALFQNQIRASDTLARLGGDEFIILLECCPLEPALRIANTILQRVQEFRFLWQDKVFNIGVSIGLVPIDADTQNMGTVMSMADAACYLAKHNGRNRVHLYQADDSEMEKAQGEMQWGVRIAQALEENRFCLYYQKIVPTTLHESREEHCEVLLRLIDEQGSLVSPMAFIPAAERYNLMPLIDRWVIRNLFTHLRQHKREQLNEYAQSRTKRSSLYAINISGASINDDQFMGFVREQLELHQIPPQILCFEITETVAIANLTKAVSFIRSLRELGCRFALDDFGSGMSSFCYLKNLPIDYLKIDGTFVRHIVEEPIDMAMVEAINQIGHVMGIQTIAEFVENEDILKKLKAIGVDYAQGYGIARPHPF
ncbi:EAL domain-containing protein [Tolypothrix bouteillei]|uniref:EAL domain-containing protein n=1 Tax=Tolypothrix bouteillei TaxID=1246981 RepID=UPI003014DC9E